MTTLRLFASLSSSVLLVMLFSNEAMPKPLPSSTETIEIDTAEKLQQLLPEELQAALLTPKTDEEKPLILLPAALTAENSTKMELANRLLSPTEQVSEPVEAAELDEDKAAAVESETSTLAAAVELATSEQAGSDRLISSLLPSSLIPDFSIDRFLDLPIRMPGNGDVFTLFPLSIPGSITSLFGWRMHPLLGEWRLHQGIDIAAPLGTPVVAAFSGRVVSADSLNGYGLTVILEHSDGTQETLYAHMSEILVEVGDWVEQGMAIGRVGSTGNSTGPHLHFEFRELTAQGWVALNANEMIREALERFGESPIALVTPEGELLQKPADINELGRLASKVLKLPESTLEEAANFRGV